MATKPKYAAYNPPRRVQIMDLAGVSPGGWWKVGQFGYALSWDKRSGKLMYLVSKSSHGRGGAAWFSPDEIRFTKGRR